MRAMVLERAGQPLRLRELPDPEPGPGQVLQLFQRLTIKLLRALAKPNQKLRTNHTQ